MKKVLYIILLAGFFWPVMASGQDKASAPLMVYYFHNTHRCMSCNAIEAQTRETLDLNFQDKMEAGEIKLLVLNAEDKENLELTEKYEVWGATLLLIKNPGSKEVVENLTNLGFTKARTKPEEFRAELKVEIDKLLN